MKRASLLTSRKVQQSSVLPPWMTSHVRAADASQGPIPPWKVQRQSWCEAGSNSSMKGEARLRVPPAWQHVVRESWC
ncbi:hypothetical protein E2C01_064078 [Portunus trituberculatus]|uniref:Uncharacterized protein n=1 Tax=Portunus trituberculatus TaxID=210409 RepID=A0A5B7HKS0_PORTR|nr:hypothetical protein [Portunus trituberculatus]